MKTSPRRSRVGRTDAVLHRILTAVAAREECGPLDLPPLYDAVDPDVVEQIDRGDETMQLSFSYLGYRIDVEGAADVDVTPEPR